VKLPSDAFTGCTPAGLDDVDGLEELLADDDDAPEVAVVDDV
jgi:hypothetical protein